jgi:hypothetical protein
MSTNTKSSSKVFFLPKHSSIILNESNTKRAKKRSQSAVVITKLSQSLRAMWLGHSVLVFPPFPRLIFNLKTIVWGNVFLSLSSPCFWLLRHFSVLLLSFSSHPILGNVKEEEFAPYAMHISRGMRKMRRNIPTFLHIFHILGRHNVPS